MSSINNITEALENINNLTTISAGATLSASDIANLANAITAIGEYVQILPTETQTNVFGQYPIENADALLQVGSGSSTKANTLFEVSPDNILLNNKVNLYGLEDKEIENKDLVSYLNFLEDRILVLERQLNNWSEGEGDEEIEHIGLIAKVEKLEDTNSILIDTYKADGETIEEYGILSQFKELQTNWDFVKDTLIEFPEEEDQDKTNRLNTYYGTIDRWKGDLDDKSTPDGEETDEVKGTINLAKDYRDNKTKITSINNFYDSIAEITDLKTKIEAYKEEVKHIDFNNYLQTASLEDGIKGILFPDTVPSEGNGAAKTLNDTIKGLINNTENIPENLVERLENLETAINALCELAEDEESEAE